MLLVDLGGDGDGRVDGVADDTDDGVGGGLGTGSGELGDDGGVGVETEDFIDVVGYWVTYRSSRVMPGFRGTPAGMRTTSAPLTASSMVAESEPTNPVTRD